MASYAPTSLLGKLWYAYADLTDMMGICIFEDKEPKLLNDFFGFHVLGVIALGLIALLTL